MGKVVNFLLFSIILSALLTAGCKSSSCEQDCFKVWQRDVARLDLARGDQITDDQYYRAKDNVSKAKAKCDAECKLRP